MHLESRSLIKKFGSRTVVDRISVRIDKGEIVGLLGPNGAGKTTTFYMIVGLEKPTHGDVYLSDICITDYPMYRRAELGISYLTQEPSIFRKLTVTENIAAILETTKLSAAEQRHKLDALLEEFHIGHVRSCRAVSGGASRSRAVLRSNRSSSCSMSRLRASIRLPSPTFRRLLSICASAAWGSSSPTTTSVRRSTSSTVSTSSARASSSSKATARPSPRALSHVNSISARISACSGRTD